MSNKKSDIRQILVLLISGVFSISLLGLVIALFINTDLPLKFSLNPVTSSQKSPAIEANNLTIGMLSEEESYTELANYLQNELGDTVKITINGNPELSYQEAKNRIAAKNWDIAFTLSPMIGVAAKDNSYTWAAKMFPDYPPYYQSALFVRADSPIRSIADLENTTVIALGDFNSASSFYMPTYDLYGKSLTIDMGHRGQNIREMVMTGKANVGAGAYSDTLQNDPEIRIIHISRNIPGSGVYLSPKLSVSDQEKITQLLLNAPPEVQKQANYGAGEEPDFSYFIGVSRRAEEVLACADFTRNPVNFFCGGTIPTANNSSSINTISGIVNGVTQINNETLRLTLAGQDNNVYHVFMSRQLLNQVPGAGNIFNLQNKQIRLTGVTFQKQSDGVSKVTLNQPSQITVLP